MNGRRPLKRSWLTCRLCISRSAWSGEGYKYEDISLLTSTYYLHLYYFFHALPLPYSNHSYSATKTNLEKMVLLRSREVEPLKAKPKTPVINCADLDAISSRSGDQSALDKPSEGSQAAMLADTVAPSLHDAGSTRSEPRALTGHVTRVTRGVNRGFNPIPGEVSGLVAASIIINDPPPDSITEPAIGS
jgi:hypothetical protein